MAFFTGLGFEFNMQFTDEEKAACHVIGDNGRSRFHVPMGLLGPGRSHLGNRILGHECV
ncbi:hypothetical protein [Paenibacillus sp. PvR053]